MTPVLLRGQVFSAYLAYYRPDINVLIPIFLHRLEENFEVDFDSSLPQGQVFTAYLFSLYRLKENFEIDFDASLPRGQVFTAYLFAHHRLEENFEVDFDSSLPQGQVFTAYLFSHHRLEENFEVDFDASLPRGQVFSAYLACCELYGIKPVNAATFGKVLRTVFPDVRTRRIGMRGQSK